MGYSQPRGSGRRQLDSAELAVVIGGGALFMIGLVAVVLVVALRGRSTPAPTLAMAPAQAQPASAPSQPLPKVVTPSVSAPPPPPPSAAPAAKSSASPIKLPDESPDEKDQHDDDEIDDGPQTIDLRAPWSRGPGADDRPSGDHGNESVSARLVREAQERSRAAREAREAARRAREEEERRKAEAAQSPGITYPPSPQSASPGIPRPTVPSFGPPEYRYHNSTSEILERQRQAMKSFTRSPSSHDSHLRSLDHKLSKFYLAAFAFAGLFSMVAAVADWDFVMNSRKARPLVWLLGRLGARVFYFLLGLFLFGLASATFFGIISSEWLKR